MTGADPAACAIPKPVISGGLTSWLPGGPRIAATTAAIGALGWLLAPR